ncbi:SurA N-terminal domain-containing protein [Ramlibacter solisilvae]|uniref:Periplasmic chaperone PpiD n=1 Tax=Ramlibacter tataouinensis TaxID=94132 RepID=A0A127JXS1_9BURK|nr:SurA N-terminal domain-containing protein [Ramlibacter tataouinensis]AMO24721.1 peptidylprolyl isomerase [Ramlibacter tataouinensis]
MFDFVRKHNKIMQFLLFLLIFPSFVLVGINGYDRLREKGDAVAKVDGHEILQGDWDEAHRREVDRLRQQMPNIDMKLLDSPAAKYGTLERLVRDRVIAAEAAKSKLTASDQRLARELQQNQMIASLRGPDGKLDMARYRQLVGAQGMSPEAFEESVRTELSTRQVLGGVAATSLATAAQAAPSIGAFLEKREVQVVRFPSSDFAARVTVTDADLESFYKANPSMFQAPEQASVEYLVLDIESIKKGVTVNEQDLKTYYEQNVARITGQEERRASHILVAVPKDAPAADREKAKAQAQELLAAARKNPDGFAELAKKNSQDTASAPNGGDLEFFTRGAMTKPFEDTVFAMKKGEIAGPVETEFGYHIVKLTDLKVPKQRSYEELKPEFEAELKKQQAQRKYAEMADTFSNAVYEQSDSLKPAADKLKLEVKTAAGVQREPARGAPGVLSSPKLLSALFAPDSLEKKRNTEAVEVAPNTLVSGRITQYTPSRTIPFDEVKDQVRQRVVAARAAELAKKEGTDKLAAWKANPAGASLPAAVTVSRQEAAQQPAEVVDAALRADPAALPALSGVDLGAQGYAVIKVNKIIPREAPAAEAARQERDQYEQWWAQAETIAYYNLLKERFKVQILVPKP